MTLETWLEWQITPIADPMLPRALDKVYGEPTLI